MKIVAVMGSPRKDGNTSQLLGSYLEGIKKTYKKAELLIVYPNEEDIKPCMGCNACKGGSPKVCIIDDDMKQYYKSLIQADVIVLATPVYWFNMSSQLKVFIDRMYGLDLKNFPAGKKLVLLMSFGDNDMIASGAVNISNSMKQMANFLGMEYLFDFGVSSNHSIEQRIMAINEIQRLGIGLEL
ncbi:MAG: flavodoxin family protein [Bacteroidota bacterium]